MSPTEAMPRKLPIQDQVISEALTRGGLWVWPFIFVK
jgi:hypothetical protein